MTDYKISPAYEVINYAWTKLKSAGVLDDSDYYSESLGQTVMPFLPVQEQPEVNLDLGKNTFFVYEYIVKPTDTDFWRKSGQVIMYAYDNDFNKLAEIVEFFSDEFNRFDGTAADINRGLLSDKFNFLSVTLGSATADRTAYEDDGRMGAEIVIDFIFTRLSTQASGRAD